VRPKGVADGHPVNIPDLPKLRLTMGRRRRIGRTSYGYEVRYT
jgi:hypothetical protein